MLFATAIGERDQPVNEHTPFDGIDEGLLDFGAVEAKDKYLDRFLGLVDSFDERRDAVSGLNEQFQAQESSRALVLMQNSRS